METCNLFRHVIQVPKNKESVGGVSSGVANCRHLDFSNGGYFAKIIIDFKVRLSITNTNELYGAISMWNLKGSKPC